MEKKDAHLPSAQDRTSRALDYLRRRSQHRIWWSSARIALRRGQSGEPLNPPPGHPPSGKRV